VDDLLGLADDPVPGSALSDPMTSGVGRVATALVLAGTLAACATTVPGQATAPPGLTPPGTSVSRVAIPAGLDTGSFSTTPYVPEQGDVNSAWVAEGNRMVEAIVAPTDIDPSLTNSVAGQESGIPVLDEYDVKGIPDPLSYSLDGLKVGVSVAGANGGSGSTRELRIGLYRLADATQLTEDLKSIGDGFYGKPTVTVAGAPSGAVSGETGPGTVDSFGTVGELLVHVHARAATTADATALAERTWSRELPAATAFQPTQEQDILRLPVDRDGILTRVLWAANPSDADTRYIGALSWRMLQERGIVDAPSAIAYPAAGVDLIGWNLGLVARTRDESAAQDLVKARSKAPGRTPVAGIPALPDVVCTKTDAPEAYSCYLSEGRYFAVLAADDLLTAQQKAAAQWTILAKTS
jgi:hypothetical protein